MADLVSTGARRRGPRSAVAPVTRAQASRAQPSRAQVPRPADPAESLIELQRTAGNRAVTELISGQAGTDITGRDGPVIVAQRGPGGATAGAPATRGSAAGGTAADVGAAEAWLRYVALRGNAPRPGAAVPAAYEGVLASLQSAIGGPGPFGPDKLVVDELAFGEGRGALKRLRADHDRLTPRAPSDVYALAEIAIDRGQANFGKGPESFEGGATQLDQGQILLAIWSAADEELKAATEGGYQVPKDLRELPSEAKAQLDAAKAGWDRGAPSSTRLTTPTDEVDLLEFMRHAADTINSMRQRRLADIARAREAEAQMLEAAAERQMAELHDYLAERRRSAFMAGDKDALHKVNEALGEVVGAINETKAAAKKILVRVDQINEAAKLFTKKGVAVINLPSVPKGISDVAGQLAKANEKLSTVVKLLDLVGPAKTKLDEGLKYLQGVDMAIEHFAGKTANPFLKVYVTAYLSPGIKNCMAQLGKIASIQHSQNVGLIEQGMPLAVNWNVEAGGEAVYAFLIQLYKVGGAAQMSDGAWEYFSDHRRDLVAAVSEPGHEDPMPANRRTIGVWAMRHRTALWQSFYGSAREPR